MSVAGDVSEPTAAPIAYARFSRRLRGVMIDTMLYLAALVGALFAAVATASDELNRLLGYSLVIALLLYEPLLVWLTGSTIGHLYSNLRVVDDASHGNVSFPKALARAVIKAILGWYSFLSMTVTRRHQALHDLLTRSTVQMRDPAKAHPHHFVNERPGFTSAAMPSRMRRVLVIAVYLVLVTGLFVIAHSGLFLAGVMSRSCAFENRCTVAENYVTLGLGLGWLALVALCLFQGWRGRLFGARRGPGHDQIDA
jgi:uncharacterized RDD family membrane protein YckC